MNLSDKFHETHPYSFFLDEDNQQALETYLLDEGWIEDDVHIQSARKAGEGNMNNVLRVKMNDGETFIIKQSRPWVEKFPDIPAPSHRANIEGLYFQKTNKNETIASFSPELLHADLDAHILIIEDLGEGSDLTYIYEKGKDMDETTLEALMNYISALHQHFTQGQCDFYIENRGMRMLNAEHIFRFPFIANNGMDLDDITPGLADVAAYYRNEAELLEQIDFLKYRYLQNGDTLLHGDFYPGSFLQTEDGTKVIDPEFCYFGDTEFDMGVFHAHLLMAGQPQEIIDRIQKHYEKPDHFSDILYEQYTGIEIMRRMLGLAQLPLALDLSEKEALLEKAYTLLMGDEEG